MPASVRNAAYQSTSGAAAALGAASGLNISLPTGFSLPTGLSPLALGLILLCLLLVYWDRRVLR